MAIGDLYKGVFTYEFAGVTMQNVLFFTAKVNGVDAEHLTLQMAGDWPSSWAYWTCDSARMVSYYAQKMNTLSAEAFTRPPSVPTFGAIDSEGAPLTSAIVVSLRTGFYGRSARGRIYLGAYPLSFLSDGKLSAGGLANVSARWGIWHDKYGAGGSNAYWTMGVYSRVVGGYNIPYDPVGFLPYTDFIVQPALGTERGRKS
jgi:hypothetical protein